MRPHVVAVLASVAASLAATSFVACSSTPTSDPTVDSRAGCGGSAKVSTVTAAEACAVIARPPSPSGVPGAWPEECRFDGAFSAAFSAANPPPEVDASSDGEVASPLDASARSDANALSDAGSDGDAQVDASSADDAASSDDASPAPAPPPPRPMVCPNYTAPITMTCETNRPCGRPYEGYVSAPVGPSAHAYLVSCMGMEAASVAAFYVLEHELRTLAAPEALLEACRAAARDEIRHAERMGELTGEVPDFPVIAPRGRTALEIALENARIGMVRETYGAIVAKVQGVRAQSANLRDVWSTIGDDEIGHAGLSWEIGAFLAGCLDANERTTVSAAMRDEVVALSAELTERPSTEHLEIGVPDVDTAQAIVAALRESLWDCPKLAA